MRIIYAHVSVYLGQFVGMSILQLLSAREYGLDPPWLLPRLYGSHRFSQLELSREKELAKVYHSPVTSIDIDPEGR